MEIKVRTIHDFLIQRARGKGLTTYTEAGALIGLNMASEIARFQIAQILDDINVNEVGQGHPMISAIVLYQNENRPGPGFFTCARGLGRLIDNDEDGFWAREVTAVHNWWGSH